MPVPSVEDAIAECDVGKILQLGRPVLHIVLVEKTSIVYISQGA